LSEPVEREEKGDLLEVDIPGWQRLRLEALVLDVNGTLAKYVYAVMHALNADVISAPLFIVFLSAVYGLLSGYFAARAFNLIKKAQMV
jgi:hypothetical protein